MQQYINDTLEANAKGLDYYIELEKQQLIDAVNSHDKDCINTANNVVSLIKPSAPKEFFTYDGKAGTEYYNKTFTKQ